MGRKPYKLTEKDVREIIESKLSMNKLARAFGVSLAMIYDIKHGNRRSKPKTKQGGDDGSNT